MRMKHMTRNAFAVGDKKCLAITTEYEDGTVKTLDMDADEAKGFAVWILYALKKLEETPIEELEQDPEIEEYRIISRSRKRLYKPLNL